LGCEPTHVNAIFILDAKTGLEKRLTISNHLKPQTVNEATAGLEFEIVRDLTLGFRGVYRAQGSVIEDGSLDDGTTYFLFNPGERTPGQGLTAEDVACNPTTLSPVLGGPVG